MLLVSGLTVGFVYFYVFTRVVISPKFLVIENQFDSEGPIPVVKEEQAVAKIKEVADKLPISNRVTRAVATATAPSVDDALAVMFDALYQPNGYIDVLEMGDALKFTDAVNRPDYWFYLAAALGQQLKVTTGEKQEEVRKQALGAAREAVKLSPSYRARLWQISTPDSVDDDLSALRNDDEFLSIVQRTQENPKNG